jgi:hypothetical protein
MYGTFEWGYNLVLQRKCYQRLAIKTSTKTFYWELQYKRCAGAKFRLAPHTPLQGFNHFFYDGQSSQTVFCSATTAVCVPLYRSIRIYSDVINTSLCVSVSLLGEALTSSHFLPLSLQFPPLPANSRHGLECTKAFVHCLFGFVSILESMRYAAYQCIV